MIPIRKKGQFYVLSIVILLFLVYLMMPKNTAIQDANQKPKNLFLNYREEIPFFVNNALLNDDPGVVRNFTMQFRDFSADKGVRFRITYIFASDSDTEVFTTADDIPDGDYTSGSVLVDPGNYTLRRDEFVSLGKVKFINLTIDNKKYDFSLDYPSFKAILIAKKGLEKDVFIYE